MNSSMPYPSESIIVTVIMTIKVAETLDSICCYRTRVLHEIIPCCPIYLQESPGKVLHVLTNQCTPARPPLSPPPPHHNFQCAPNFGTEGKNDTHLFAMQEPLRGDRK